MSLRKLLERVRAGYPTEKAWHKFLLDAYTGGGGFQGRIKSDDGELGAAASCYGDVTNLVIAGGATLTYQTEVSYLDRYPREDDLKFCQRKAVSYYLNHIKPITDLKLAFMLVKPFVVEGLPKKIEDWKGDVDGQGTTWEQARNRAAFRAAILGYCPTIVDLPPKPEGVKTIAQSKEAGTANPVLTLLFPANLTEWYRDGGKLRWVKVRTDHIEHPDPLADATKYTRYDIWNEQSVRTYRVSDEAAAEAILEDEVFHDFGCVPLAVCRHSENDADPLKGTPMHGDESKVARRLFNISSELDENLRSHAFALLVLAKGIDVTKGGGGTDEDDGDDEITVGTDNAIVLNEMATQKHYYLGPPANIAESLEKRAAELIREIYRMARVEHVRPAGVADATGIARRYAFAATNAAIAAFAQLVAQWEQEVYRLVGKAMNVSDAELEKIRVVAPTEFDIEDLASAIKEATDSIGIDLGPTAAKAIKARLVKTLLPNADEDTLKQIIEELEDQVTQDAADKAFDKSGNEPPLKPGEKPADGDEEDDLEDDAA